MKYKGSLLRSFLLALVVAIGLMAGMSKTAYAVSVPMSVKYYDADGKPEIQECILFNYLQGSERSNLSAGWYAVMDGSTESVFDTIKINGDVHLILYDGATLNVGSTGISNGIYVASGGSLTIYGQKKGDGILNVKDVNNGIYVADGDVTINGGTVTAKGSQKGITASRGNITINGGVVTATATGTGTTYRGINTDVGDVKITGGTVTAKGNQYGIKADDVMISGGDVTAIGTTNGGISCYTSLTIDQSLNVEAGVSEAYAKPIDKSQYSDLHNSTKYIYTHIKEPDHTHNFAYTASGATITATCDVENCTLTGGKAELTIIVPELNSYGGSGEAAATLNGLSSFNTATGKTIAATDIKYVGRDGTTYSESATAPTDAGKYTAKITVEEKTASVDYEIAKAASSVSAAPSSVDPTYNNGQPLALVSAGTASGGTMYYSVDGGDYSESIPTGEKVGTYTVSYKVVGDKNHTDTDPASITVEIKKAAASVDEPASAGLTYTGEAQDLVTGGSVTGGTLQYAVLKEEGEPSDSDEDWTAEAKGTNAGDYYVWYRVIGDDNHNGVGKTFLGKVTIAKATIDPSVDITGWEYGKGPNAPSVDGNIGNGPVRYEYSNEKEGNYSETVPKDVGSYYVKAIVEGTDNTEAATTEPRSFAISTANIVLTADNKTSAYGEDIVVLTYQLSGKLADGDDLGVTLSTTATRTSEVGTYPITVSWKDDNPNYSVTLNNGTYTITEAVQEQPAVTVTAPAPAPAPAAVQPVPQGLVIASAKTVGKRTLKLSWTKVAGAEGFDIYLGNCGKQDLPQVATVGGSTYSYTVKGLKKFDAYKAYVVAWRTVDGVKSTIGESPATHTITGGYTNKYTNPKKVSVKRTKVKLAVGKTAKVKASVTKVKNSRKLMNHESKLRYYSSNPAVATVSTKGTITAVGAGSCKIYAVAVNGLYKAVTVTVK